MQRAALWRLHPARALSKLSVRHAKAPNQDWPRGPIGEPGSPVGISASAGRGAKDQFGGRGNSLEESRRSGVGGGGQAPVPAAGEGWKGDVGRRGREASLAGGR